MGYQIYNSCYNFTVTDFLNELVYNNIPCHIIDRGPTMPSNVFLSCQDEDAKIFIVYYLLPAHCKTIFEVDNNLKYEVSYLGLNGNLQVVNIKERMDSIPKITLKDQCICSKEKFGFAGHADYCSISNFKEVR